MINELNKIITHIKVIPNDTGGQVNYLRELSEYKAELAELIPDVEHYYSEKLAEVTERIRAEFKGSEKGNASLMANKIKSEMREHQKLVSLADRINSTINFQGDNLRTIISFYKIR